MSILIRCDAPMPKVVEFQSKTTKPQTICVIGAGVVGMATVVSLYEAGHSVILIEKESAPATKTSSLNGCQLSYSFVDALASPSTLKAMPKLTMGLDPAFRIDFGAVFSNPSWLMSFFLNSTRGRFHSNTLAALSLAAHSRNVLHRWEVDYGLDFNRKRAGKLVLIGSSQVKRSVARSVELKRFGCAHQQVISRRHALELEPALNYFQGAWIGATYSPDDEVGNPQAFCNSVKSAMAGRKRIDFRFDGLVQDVILRKGRIAHLVVNDIMVEADAFVFCTGHLTSKIARKWGERLPILPMAGYSVTVPAKNKSPRISLTDLKAKTVVTRLGNTCRCAGLADLGNAEEKTAENRAHQFKKILMARFGPMIGRCEDVETWIGHRPMTPNSLPIIRKAKLDNAYLNCGHGMLGWTMAAGSAEVLARTIEADHLSR